MSAPLRLPRLRRPVGWRDLDAAVVESRALAAFLSRHPMRPLPEAALGAEAASGLHPPQVTATTARPDQADVVQTQTGLSPTTHPQPSSGLPLSPTTANRTPDRRLRSEPSRGWWWGVACVLALAQALWLVAALLARGPAHRAPNASDSGAITTRSEADDPSTDDLWSLWQSPRRPATTKPASQEQATPPKSPPR